MNDNIEHPWDLTTPGATSVSAALPSENEPGDALRLSEAGIPSRANALSTKAVLASLSIMAIGGAAALFVIHSTVHGDPSRGPQKGVAELQAAAGAAAPAPAAIVETPALSTAEPAVIASAVAPPAVAATIPPTPTPPIAASPSVRPTSPALIAPASPPQARGHLAQVHVYPFAVPTPPASPTAVRKEQAESAAEEPGGNPYEDVSSTAILKDTSSPKATKDAPGPAQPVDRQPLEADPFGTRE